MKQAYTDKMKYYQGKEYENFLREKCVLDARQFLYSSQLYLNYAKDIVDYMHEEKAYKETNAGEIIPFSLAKEIRSF